MNKETNSLSLIVSMIIPHCKGRKSPFKFNQQYIWIIRQLIVFNCITQFVNFFCQSFTYKKQINNHGNLPSNSFNYHQEILKVVSKNGQFHLYIYTRSLGIRLRVQVKNLFWRYMLCDFGAVAYAHLPMSH